jgi:hypothetical protein
MARTDRSPSRESAFLRAERFVTAAIIAVALALALVWVFRVPFFEEPDENAHADYAFTLFTVHAPFRAQEGRAATDVHPLVRYLEERSDFRTIHYNPDGRAPAGYGSAAFYRDVDSRAPGVAADFLAHDGGRVPWVARQYSYLYYALDAMAIGAAALVSGGSAVAEFFGARILNVALLAVSLILTYLTLGELRVHRLLRLVLIAAIAWFPLTSWVSAYVQPDNLAFAAIALVFYLSLRARREADVMWPALWLGLGLGLLAMTKSQYFVAVALPALADRSFRSAPHLQSAVRRAFYVLLVCAPAALLIASSFAIRGSERAYVSNAIAANGDPLGVALHHGSAAFAAYAGSELVAFLSKTFSWGLPFVSYWGMISWTGTQIRFGGPSPTALVFQLLSACSLVIFVLVTARTASVWIRLARVAQRSPRASWRLLLGDVIFNSYVLFIAVMAAIWVASGGELGTQGRYWLPFILPATLCATRYALPHFAQLWRLRRAFAMVGASVLLLYSIAGSIAALAALDDRFYRAPSSLNPYEYQARITGLGPVVDGWAVDSRSGEPARRVDLVIDGRIRVPARTGMARRDAALRLHDDALLDSGFAAPLPRRLPSGRHSLRLDVYEAGRAAPYPSRAVAQILVGPQGATRP